VPTDLAGIKLPSVHVESHVYVTRDDGPLNLDLYRLHTLDTPAPCIVHIHGGAWERGGPGDWPQIHRYLASRGYVVASIDYRKVPAHRFPAPQEDVGAALSFLKANAAHFRLDPHRFILTGRSAGGQIALLAAYTGDTSIRGVAGLYAPTDMRFGYEHPARKAVLDSCSVLSSYLGGTPGTIPQVYTNASPIDRGGPATPPTLLIHGSRDEVVWIQQSRRLAERLHRAGRPHLLLELPWATHGMDILIGTPGGQICTYAIERFVAAVTG
jgi:acetyl esterase/lipase